MIEYALIAVTIVQGASLGQYDTHYDVVQTYPNAKACQVAMRKQSKDDFKVYTCLKVDKD
jgi:hypothetical protein